MISIRLQRIGKKKKPFYRLIVIPKTASVKSRAIEILGFYNPISEPAKIEIKKDRLKYWLGVGAQTTNTVNNLLVEEGFLPKSEIIKKTVTKKKKKKKEEKIEKPADIPVPKAQQKQEGESLLEDKSEIEERISEEKTEEAEKKEREVAITKKTDEVLKEKNTEKPEEKS